MSASDNENGPGNADQDLVGRLRRLEDAEQIRTLFLTYGSHLDAKDWEPYSNLFTEDGEFIAPIGVARGPDAIRELFDGRLRDVPSGTHLITNLSVEIDGDRATVRALWTYIGRDSAGMPTLTQNGTYDSALVRVDRRWMFRRHEIARTTGVAPYQS
jgi:uncharacterized protein (TIGR02246 family)